MSSSASLQGQGEWLVKVEGFAVNARVIEANASHYHGKAPDEFDWTDAKRQKRAMAEYLAALATEAGSQDERSATTVVLKRASV